MESEEATTTKTSGIHLAGLLLTQIEGAVKDEFEDPLYSLLTCASETMLAGQTEKHLKSQTTTTDITTSGTTSTEPTIEKYVDDHPQQQKLNSTIVNFVAGTLQPLSIVESKEFKTMAATFDPLYIIPSWKHLATSLIPSKSDQIQANMCKILKNIPSACLTIDLWSANKMSYFGMTCHFVLDWKLETMMLSCKRFKGKHTGNNIHSSYSDTIKCFDIHDKVLSVTSNNMHNLTKGLSRSGCQIVFANPARGYDNESSSEDEGDTKSNADKKALLQKTTEHISCFAHSLQLVMKDVLNASIEVHEVLARALVNVAYIGKLSHEFNILERVDYTQTVTPICWNSKLKTVRSLLALPADKLNELNTVGLTKYDFKLLKDLCAVLAPVEEALDYVQRPSAVTSSYVIPCVRGIKAELKSRFHCQDSELVTALRDSVSKHLLIYERIETFVLAAVLDPRFKLKWCISDTEAYFKHRTALITKANAVTETTPSKAENKQPVPEKNSPPCKRKRLFSYMKHQNEPLPEQLKVEKEVQDYLSSPCMPEDLDPLQYWQMNESTYPTLAALAQHYLSIPAASAFAENPDSSIRNKILLVEQNALSDVSFESVLNIKYNASYVQKHL